MRGRNRVGEEGTLEGLIEEKKAEFFASCAFEGSRPPERDGKRGAPKTTTQDQMEFSIRNQSRFPRVFKSHANKGKKKTRAKV